MTGGFARKSCLAALAVLCLAAAAPACAKPAAPERTAETYWGAGAWEAYKAHFLTSDGRITDDGNKGISHSEGQGYGMLLAIFANDRPSFDKIWSFASRELYVRKDGLAAWKWEPDQTPHTPDQNNATDGDILIAWALAEAGARWQDARYTAAARQIALAIGRNALGSSSFGPVLRPGAAGFGVLDSEDGPVVNQSYWVYPAFDALKRVAPEVSWHDIKASGLALLAASRSGPTQLPSDWTSLREIKPQPAKNFPALFGYNAIRIPLYLAWGGLADADRLAPFAAQWRRSEAAPALVDVASGAPGAAFGDLGYSAVSALTRCAADGAKIPAELRQVRPEKYYSTTLHMLTLVAAQQRFGQCL